MHYLKTTVPGAIIALLLIVLMGPATARAQSITFIHEGTSMNGFLLNGEAFPGQYDFIITAFGDVGDREEILGGNGWFIDHTAATIEIVGFGTFGILTPTRTGVNNSGGRVGFSRAGLFGAGLLSGPSHPDFVNWDMTTSIGPISGNDGHLIQWAQEPFIETTGGILEFDNEENIPVTFTAMVVSGPGPIALLPLAAILCPRRRRRC